MYSVVADSAPAESGEPAADKSKRGSATRQRKKPDSEREKMSQTTDILSAAKEHGWTVRKSAVKTADRGGAWPEKKDLPTHIFTMTRGEQIASMAVVPHASNESDFRMVRGNRKLGATALDGAAVKLPELLEVLSKSAPKSRGSKSKSNGNGNGNGDGDSKSKSASKKRGKRGSKSATATAEKAAA